MCFLSSGFCKVSIGGCYPSSGQHFVFWLRLVFESQPSPHERWTISGSFHPIEVRHPPLHVDVHVNDTLANEGTTKEKPTSTPHIHTTHMTPSWLASCPTTTHDGAICNLHTFVTKAHDNQEVRTAQAKFPYVGK